MNFAEAISRIEVMEAIMRDLPYWRNEWQIERAVRRVARKDAMRDAKTRFRARKKVQYSRNLSPGIDSPSKSVAQ